MSLIPSKRVDRIFPIVPPLCLLVAAGARTIPTRWLTAALIFAAVFTTGYAAQRVIISYRNDEGALVRFGAEVRRAAAANNWRYEIVGGKEEGPLLYLDRLRFTTPAEAVQQWNAGTLDALVVPADEVPGLTNAKPSGIEGAVKINARERRYLLLKREE
jgi:hypothetical protein